MMLWCGRVLILSVVVAPIKYIRTRTTSIFKGDRASEKEFPKSYLLSISRRVYGKKVYVRTLRTNEVEALAQRKINFFLPSRAFPNELAHRILRVSKTYLGIFSSMLRTFQFPYKYARFGCWVQLVNCKKENSYHV